MSDDERIEQLELEVKLLQANNKGLKDKIDEQSNDEKIFLQFGEIIEKKRWKDKIKAKIEWLDKEGYFEFLSNRDILKCHNILASLLEKE